MLSVIKKVAKAVYRVGQTENHWARVVMDKHTGQLVDALGPDNLNVLEISGSVWGQRKKFRSHTSVEYPNFDICTSVLDSRYDLIIAEQVFEHLLDPYQAIKNIRLMLNEGGHVLLTTPFLLRVHAHPLDCYRWTATGIVQLLKFGGFRTNTVSVDSWGNRACVVANFDRWAYYRPLLHSLVNEPEFPVVVWAVAETRPLSDSERTSFSSEPARNLA